MLPISNNKQSPAGLHSISTAVPSYKLKQADIMEASTSLFANSFRDFERLKPIFSNAAIGTRYSCVPLEWYLSDHSFAERNELFIKYAVDLLEEVIVKCLDISNLNTSQIDAIVVTTTSGISVPSLDALLVERLLLRNDILRLPIFGLGCAGGVIGLARAAALAQAMPEANILFAVVELCGLTFRFNDRSKSNLIATALFGDGASACLLTTACDKRKISAWGEHTWPKTLDTMGWHIENDGFGVLFSRDIPSLIRSKLRKACDNFLEKHSLTMTSIDEFACHPGGAKVLEALEEVFELKAGSLTHSRTVLNNYGNMSAATIMFVLERVLNSQSERKHKLCLLSSLGPGFTAGFALLEDL